MERPVPIGIEHVAAYSPERLIRASISLLEHASAHGEEEGIDVILVGVPAAFADEVREAINAAIAQRFAPTWVDPPHRDPLPDETLENVRPLRRD